MGNEIRVILFRERYLDELKDIVKKIKNDQRINNWVQLSTDFDTMKKLIDDHGVILAIQFNMCVSLCISKMV